MMFERRQIGAGNAPSGPAWLVAGAPRPQMQHDGAAELSFAPPCHNDQPHGRAPGSTGPMAEVVDTQQGPDLDQELVRRVQRGDSAAFDLLVRKYQPRIAALIGRYISDWSECQDVAQDTFIRAYRPHGTFRGDAQLYTWLNRIVDTTAPTHLLAPNPRPPTEATALDAAETVDPSTTLPHK